MERNAAACAMEWSTELERALRSWKPGQAVEAILHTGSRLEQWSREPEPTVAMYHMFGLVADEDKLYANTILLRLANAFKMGDKDIKLAVVRAFLAKVQHRDKRKSKFSGGIFSRERVSNQVELLARIKAAFDAGDVESRALALVIFGCWADFARDNAQIRYLILSSLLSTQPLVVKASLFSASCFSELADDFAFIFLEMLPQIVSSSAMSTVTVACAWAFGKLRCSFAVAKKAYKTGLKLLAESSEEDFVIIMLFSLSRIASKSLHLCSEQVILLCSFLSCEKALRLQEASLKCLHFLSTKGACQFIRDTCVVDSLARMIDEATIPAAIHCRALGILHQIFSDMPPNHGLVDIDGFSKLFAVVENAIRSPNTSKSILAVRLLVDLSIELKGRSRLTSDSLSSISPFQVISVIIDKTSLLAEQLLDPCHANTKVFQGVQSLLCLLFRVIREDPDLSVLVLGNICSLIENLLVLHNYNVRDCQQEDMRNLRLDEGKHFGLKLVRIIYGFVAACIHYLNQGIFTTALLEKVKHLVDCVRQSNLFNSRRYLGYSLSLHCKLFSSRMLNEEKETGSLSRTSEISICKYLAQQEVYSLEIVTNMLTEKDYWRVYKSGKHAACHSSWYTALFIFAQLAVRVHSNFCLCWLKALAQFAFSEGKLQMLRLAGHESSLVDWLEKQRSTIKLGGIDLHVLGNLISGDSSDPQESKILLEAHQGLNCSVKTLETVVMSDSKLYFQIWFLSLRTKVIGSVQNILQVLGSIPYNFDSDNYSLKVGENATDLLKYLQDLPRISLHLKRLALEYDQIARSFIGIDSQSLKVISTLALSCSLLAFCSGFTLFVPELSTILAENFGKFSSITLIQNLVGRFWSIDHEMSEKLSQLLQVGGGSSDCLHLKPENKILECGYEAKDILTLCSNAISGVVCLQSERHILREKTILQVTVDGIKLLSNTLGKWTRIPFCTPKYFFEGRHSLGSELFVSDANGSKPDGIYVLRGFHLSLNLCLQLKHVPSELHVQLTKLFCILRCRPSFQQPRTGGDEKTQLNYRDWGDDDIVEMNNKLFHYVKGCCRRRSHVEKDPHETDREDDKFLHAIAQFEPNPKGQGFSSCLLDVSSFPPGCYRIKWCGGSIDNQGIYRNLLPLNAGPVFTIQRPPVAG